MKWVKYICTAKKLGNGKFELRKKFSQKHTDAIVVEYDRTKSIIWYHKPGQVEIDHIETRVLRKDNTPIYVGFIDGKNKHFLT